jgi:hypothetical protein
MEPGFNDTMHGSLTFVWVFFVLVAVVCGAVAYRGWFRLYSIGSLVAMAVFGGLAGASIPRIADNLPTPWMGAFERINAYVYLAWLVVLAITVMRRSLSDVTPEPTDIRMQVRHVDHCGGPGVDRHQVGRAGRKRLVGSGGPRR